MASVFSTIAISTLLTGCHTPPSSGLLSTPVFSTLEIPNASGGWMTYSTSAPPPKILPVKGRGVKIWFYAPFGSVFDVSLSESNGAITALPNSYGNPMPLEAGFYEIQNVNTNPNPALYTMYVRAPLALTDQANYDVLVVNKSLRTNVADSSPMVVALRQQDIFTVAVVVEGNGHVTSNPPGIQCGLSPSGRVLTDCIHEFGYGQVSLAPGSNDSSTTKFEKWDGNCAPNIQVCTLTLDGKAPAHATARFVPRTAAAPPVSSCPAAPMLPGWRWNELPNCGSILNNPGATLQCDVQGYYCCGASGGNASARCNGLNETQATCAKDDLGISPGNERLIQPGGCYEVNNNP